METKPTDHPDTAKPLTAEEAAAYLDLSISALYKLTSGREIAFYKPSGKRIYFKRCDLDAYAYRVKHEPARL